MSMPSSSAFVATTARISPSRSFRLWDSDLAYSFRRSPVAVVSGVVLLICLGASLFAPWVAPHNPFDLATLNLLAPDMEFGGPNVRAT